MNKEVKTALAGTVRPLFTPWVFYKPEAGGRYYDIRESFGSACEKAGIEGFHFHDLRHTFASQLVMNGVDITTVSKLLGHSSLVMTLRYSHLAPSHLKSAVDILATAQKNSLHDSSHDNDSVQATRG